MKTISKTSNVPTKPKVYKSGFQLRREKFTANRQFILAELGLSELEYHNLLYQLGMDFLELIYDKDCHFEHQKIKKLAENKQFGFWNWWCTEWMVVENNTIILLEQSDKKLTKNIWKFWHEEALFLPYMEPAFYEFLKQFN